MICILNENEVTNYFFCIGDCSIVVGSGVEVVDGVLVVAVAIVLAHLFKNKIY